MLKEQIQKDYLVAFKNKDRVSTDTLGMLKAAIQYVEVDARAKGKELHDEDIISIIQAEVKKRKEAIDSFSSSQMMKDSIGEILYNKLIEAKTKEWDEYKMKVTQWELDKYLPII